MFRPSFHAVYNGVFIYYDYGYDFNDLLYNKSCILAIIEVLLDSSSSSSFIVSTHLHSFDQGHATD